MVKHKVHKKKKLYTWQKKFHDFPWLFHEFSMTFSRPNKIPWLLNDFWKFHVLWPPCINRWLHRFSSKQETFFVLTFNPKPEDSNKVSLELSYFDLVEQKTANAEGIINTIKESFKEVKENYLDKLDSFGSDVASIKRGEHEGIKIILQRENESCYFQLVCSTQIGASTQQCI